MHNSANAVGYLIDNDLNYLESLITLLGYERQALEQRDAARLQEVVQEKKTLLLAMEDNGRQRDRQLRQLGLDNDPRNWRVQLERLVQNNEPGMQEKWQELLEKLQQCADMTEINSRIVTRAQHTVGRMLDLFRGQKGAPINTYDNLGRNRQHYDNRPITSA